MRLPKFISRVVNDPPPRFVFELSEAGIAVGRSGAPPQVGFTALEAGVLAVSPVKDNVLRMDVLSDRVKALAPRGEKKRQRAVLILPDHAVRVSVLDFDAFPNEAEQQASLVRFRIKKSLPFDLDAAHVSYFAQAGNGGGKKHWDVVVAVTPLEILARYEAPFRAAGFQPGVVTTSALCALELVREEGVVVLAKLSGRALTLAVTAGGVLKLLRTLELADGGAEEIASHLFPTFAYIEDNLAARAKKIVACGLGSLADELRREIDSDELEVEPLRSRFASPHPYDAGLLGYLEAMEEA